MTSDGPTAESSHRRVNFLGCPLDLISSETFLAEAKAAIERRDRPRVVQFVNGNKVAKIAEDASFGALMWRADYVLTDGQPMIPMARMLGARIPERIDGIGLMGKLLQLCDAHGFRVYLLGAKPQVVEACVDRIRTDYPGAVVCGFRDGYFKREELQGIAREIRASTADVLFLGIGSPAKEELADEFRDEFGVPIIQGVGGSFDVLAGLVKRSPRWMQRIGLEWLFRVYQEPRRMFWRYATTNTACLRVFVWTLLRKWRGEAVLEPPPVSGGSGKMEAGCRAEATK